MASNSSASVAARALFEEVVAVFRAVDPRVSLSRKFGRPCAKLAKRAIVVVDGHLIAFRTGEQTAALCMAYPAARPWNPNAARQPKESWLAHPADDGHVLAHLAAAAFRLACRSPGTDLNARLQLATGDAAMP